MLSPAKLLGMSKRAQVNFLFDFFFLSRQPFPAETNLCSVCFAFSDTDGAEIPERLLLTGP